ncbi:hypothetical protein SKAU_G00096480 [Synaphobranchus kaupii]|uniref:Uncharacterized protein n=1 Tax=Synaphobranchus kaupii TaxID=118154 RepID=A0A9Q1FXQ3_SYNKA|nr:hypothetical protein SKAU_G00096480 [Synaphobranchus kaupii]
MAEGPEEEEFAYLVEEPQQEEKIQLKFQMKEGDDKDDRVLTRNHVGMKQLYRVPFQKKSDIVKEARLQYVQSMMDIDAGAEQHEIIYVDEAGFNLCKRRRRGWNVNGQRATVEVPAWRQHLNVCCHFPQWS